MRRGQWVPLVRRCQRQTNPDHSQQQPQRRTTCALAICPPMWPRAPRPDMASTPPGFRPAFLIALKIVTPAHVMGAAWCVNVQLAVSCSAAACAAKLTSSQDMESGIRAVYFALAQKYSEKQPFEWRPARWPLGQNLCHSQSRVPGPACADSRWIKMLAVVASDYCPSVLVCCPSRSVTRTHHTP